MKISLGLSGQQINLPLLSETSLRLLGTSVES